MPMRFLHLADVHIGLRVTRFDDQVARKLKEARFQALDNALAVAANKKVDFVVIAGDLFDDNTVSLVDAQRAFDMLKNKRMPIFVLPGNHDPYCAGSVWQRHPWNDTSATTLKVLAAREAVLATESATLYPCPATSSRSREDPTGWIPPREQADGIRIGVAHGSVMDRATLPEDDHPIPQDAARARGLDYLALGHWHQSKEYRETDGAARIAYPGTLEQMSFGSAADFSIGWAPYASGAEREEFCGAGLGQALLVQIAAPEAVPVLERVDTGQYVWQDESVSVSDDEHFQSTFAEIARRERPERCLLRLRVEGLLPAESMLRLEGFREMLNRYLHCVLDADGVSLVPDDSHVADVAGSGVVGEVYQRLKDDLATDLAEAERDRRERAVLVLYRLAQEVGE
ncbi:MAG: DNA repair exonuclease [Armatimonadia bacterium]